MQRATVAGREKRISSLIRRPPFPIPGNIIIAIAGIGKTKGHRNGLRVLELQLGDVRPKARTSLGG